MDYSELKQHLIPFVDAISLDEVIGILEDQIQVGFLHVIQGDAAYLDAFLASDLDKLLLREFVVHEMNLDFSDPTGEAEIQWLLSVRQAIQSALSSGGEHKCY